MAMSFSRAALVLAAITVCTHVESTQFNANEHAWIGTVGWEMAIKHLSTSDEQVYRVLGLDTIFPDTTQTGYTIEEYGILVALYGDYIGQLKPTGSNPLLPFDYVSGPSTKDWADLLSRCTSTTRTLWTDDTPKRSDGEMTKLRKASETVMNWLTLGRDKSLRKDLYALNKDHNNAISKIVLSSRDDLMDGIENSGRDGLGWWSENGDKLDAKIRKWTGPMAELPIISKFTGRMIFMAKENFDHFGADARASYIGAHTLALRSACDIGEEWARTENHIVYKSFLREKLMRTVIQYEGLSHHFMSDLFAAGHLRTPRRTIQAAAQTNDIGGLWSKCMHDEENQSGLSVKNKNGDMWRAWGDAHLFTRKNEKNRRMAMEAVKVSLLDVFAELKSCYNATKVALSKNAEPQRTVVNEKLTLADAMNGDVDQAAKSRFKALDVIPDLEELLSTTGQNRNPKPMFVEKESTRWIFKWSNKSVKIRKLVQGRKNNLQTTYDSKFRNKGIVQALQCVFTDPVIRSSPLVEDNGHRSRLPCFLLFNQHVDSAERNRFTMECRAKCMLQNSDNTGASGPCKISIEAEDGKKGRTLSTDFEDYKEGNFPNLDREEHLTELLKQIFSHDYRRTSDKCHCTKVDSEAIHNSICLPRLKALSNASKVKSKVESFCQTDLASEYKCCTEEAVFRSFAPRERDETSSE